MTEHNAEYVAAVEGATVKKLGYSAAPWRIVTPDGREVCTPVVFDHPSLGKMVIQEAGYDRKRDAVAALAELRARLTSEDLGDRRVGQPSGLGDGAER
jgi:hypothetical protein